MNIKTTVIVGIVALLAPVVVHAQYRPYGTPTPSFPTPMPMPSQPNFPTTSQPNVFGGQNIQTPNGMIQSQPNVFGGQNYTLPNGGGTIVCTPNVFGGQNCN